jgi:hypothetical protein
MRRPPRAQIILMENERGRELAEAASGSARLGSLA